MKCILNTDGGSRGNPGPSGAGFVLRTHEGLIKGKKLLGEKTNNEAEYLALILGFEKAVEKGCKELEVRMDSELIVKQLKGEYKTKDKKLIPLFGKVLALSNKFDHINYIHVPREKNKMADKLANEALDNK